MSECEFDERLHYIKQFQEIKRLAEAAEWAVRREAYPKASGHLHEMQGRVEAVSDDFDPSNFVGKEGENVE